MGAVRGVVDADETGSLPAFLPAGDQALDLVAVAGDDDVGGGSIDGAKARSRATSSPRLPATTARRSWPAERRTARVWAASRSDTSGRDPGAAQGFRRDVAPGDAGPQHVHDAGEGRSVGNTQSSGESVAPLGRGWQQRCHPLPQVVRNKISTHSDTLSSVCLLVSWRGGNRIS
ncbi:hypothetical protein PL81_33875 [Streptomyces sp. RSD-27]|nr:hypothetical protein PL81_33875 [Streptomyces sp. RSD-27]